MIDKKRSKCLIVALNIERNDLEKGTDDQVQGLIDEAGKCRVPVVYTSVRSRLGRAFTGKFGPRISVVSIIDYQGYVDWTEEMFEEWRLAKKRYDDL